MAQLSEGVINLPGAFGTLDELFEMLTLNQLGQEQQPIGILNVKGYFDPLIAQMNHMAKEGFLKPEYLKMIHVDEDPDQLLKKLKSSKFKMPKEKWRDRPSSDQW